MMVVYDIVLFMMMILIRMTFITVAKNNDGAVAVAVDNGDQLFVCLFSNLLIIIIL